MANPPRAVLMLGTSPLMRGGVASVVAALRDGGLFEKANVKYVATHVDGSLPTKLIRIASAVMTVLVALVRGEVGIVHAHVSSRGSFWRKAILLALAAAFRRPIVTHLHSGDFDSFAQSGHGFGLRRWVVRRVLDHSNRVLVLSRRWAEWVVQFAPRARPVVVGNPVALPAEPVHDAAPAHKGGRVLYLGKICQAKGSFDLLEAWKIFGEHVPDWRLVIGGNGEVDDFLVRAKELGLAGGIEYLGWVSGSDKARELERADIFVLPSYAEGLPVSVLEAMAYGCAVIATPVGGVPDMMQPGVHGLWVQPGNVAALARALEDLASDPARRARLGQAARLHVQRDYATEVVVARIESVYAEIARTTASV